MTLIKKIYSHILLLLLPAFANGASLNYQLSAPLPGSGATEVSTIAQYAPFLFPFLLSVAAGSAFVMFTYGAIQYMASGGNPSKTGEAKSIMTDAIIGLLLAVGSVFILRTINPALVELNLNIPNIPSTN
ncbi:MAG TPA: hypothetical protein VJB56_00875 [Candidatus Paceibacterota bacterium]